MHVDEAAGDPIKAQVHVLGGMDQSETKKVVCGTTKGDIRINIKPFWSPRGAARFLQLVHKDLRYFDGCALNRVVPGFLTQFGIGADYSQRTEFRVRDIPDDPHLDPPIPFRPGTMSYAGSGRNSRSNEIFIVQPDTPKRQLDYFGGENTWETPFGYVEPDDLKVVASWHSYGDMTPVSSG
jgi:cyclophilin family peptidyl-prolyl cis-trans isomerase